MAKIKVDLKDRSYDIIVGAGILAELGKLIKDNSWGREIFIITDPLVNDLFGDKLRAGLKGFKIQTLEVPRGERYKTLKTAAALIDQMVRYKAHRDSLVIAMGGGVIGDIAGYVASSYMRGINYIQVPTTLLAQVDASIGGKTGVNHPKCKNLIGAFYQPKLVYIDIETLKTLPARELRTGLAEVVKYGVIEDAAFFKFIEQNARHLNTKSFESPDTLRAALKVWHTIVAESAKIKAKVVAKDETESGIRMILNYGHTVGHAIETLTKYKSYNHGEAVAIGMAVAAGIANMMRMISQDTVDRIVELISQLGLPTEPVGLPAKKIVDALQIDKKVRGGKVLFVLPERIGKVEIKETVTPRTVERVLKEMKAK
ncbi:MAG: 3-dehydroquinate synthase [Candidatus Margulisbacteria bacterium]|nr:3-dehydroquinate synthase [Candidatus Margulisiibacteriota bacterium]